MPEGTEHQYCQFKKKIIARKYILTTAIGVTVAYKPTDIKFGSQEEKGAAESATTEEEK